MSIICLIGVLVFSLQFKQVQTYAAKKAAKYLSSELKTKVEVKSLYIKPFKSVVLEGLYIEDQQKDTLLYSPNFLVNLNLFSFKNRVISVNTIQMDNGKFYLKQFKDNTSNFAFIINYLNTGVAKPKTTKPKKPYDITFDKIVLNNIAFKYKHLKYNDTIKGINFNDIYLRNVNATVLNLDTKTHLAKANIKNLTFREKSGFYLKNLTTKLTIDSNRMEFNQLLLQTQNTYLTNNLVFKYSSFKDFNHFNTNVYLKADFNNTRVNSSDIAYFVPALSKTKVDMRLSGHMHGYVNNIKTKNLTLTTGKATYLKGDFNIKGLPNLKETFLDLNFEQVFTNKKDLDYIIARATGKKKSLIPLIVNKFGNVNFKGRFTGFTDDFIAYGEFKTKLGRIISDVNLKINSKGIPSYTGLVKAYDFNLGDLLDQSQFGRTTLVANVKGKGMNLKNLQEKISSTITYFDFKGYRYQNIALNGVFNKNLFDGRIKVNDRNIKLDFSGGVNLNPALPEFHFNSMIRHANLRVLNLVKDTVQIDADFKTNFTGNSLDNIQGQVYISKARLTNTKNSFVVDSVDLSANGIGNNRSLIVKSDILEASIKGKYDLKTLPSYFKTLLKKYIPSMQLNLGVPKAQNFEFALNIKHFEPISLLFFPEIKIPEQANFSGKFVSLENIATLNGFAKLITYKKIKINNLIIDGSTAPDAMNLFVTSDRVDITDSLYFKNINVSNILRNDSLNLNVKMSDKNAINQLDLNGLVEFNAKTFASLSLLPSDVVINRETWKIQEKVKIDFNKGKTYIENFGLFRDNQLLTVNGIISASPQDVLVVGFNKFKLTTFNSLTTGAGVTLKGELNGNAEIASTISKTPKVEAEIKVDSLNFNNIAIGDLTLSAAFDNSTKLINVNMDILNQGTKTLDIAGTYNANADQNNLNMDVKMKNNELVIFQPFLKNLVSNLNGKISAELKVTGRLSNPQLNGFLDLANAGMTINFLKTNYKLSDKISVDNSVLKLSNLIITDTEMHEAIANGTVDLSNPSNPTIDLTIVAQNLMALNTTAKDNSLYYGKAYGTGVFSFNGPTNNMRINIDAKTEEGTVFNIPFNSSATVRDNDFITFVAKDSALNIKKETSFNGLEMSFKLEVDENSEVNIITDLGKLTGRGKANLDLNITSLGDFEMFGAYQITKGKFSYTAQDYINKIFEISSGGSIRWTGNPTEAAINLQAVYSVRTSLKPLFEAAGRPKDEKGITLSEAIMNLNGPLLNPAITFGLNFPTDAEVENQLQSYLSDVNNTNEQALNLIIRRSFTSGSGGANIDQTYSTLINAGAEIFFNQLNSVISQTFNLTNIDFNIRNFNDASASFRFLKDRLVLTGGVSSRYNNLGKFQEFNVISGNVARDVEAQYLLRKDGTLVLRASNRLDNRTLLSPGGFSNSAYVNALGLVYRKDFDNLNELFKMLRRKEKEKKQQEDSSLTAKPSAILPSDKNSANKKISSK